MTTQAWNSVLGVWVRSPPYAMEVAAAAAADAAATTVDLSPPMPLSMVACHASSPPFSSDESHDHEHDNTGDTCAICLDALPPTLDGVGKVGTCLHAFHFACLKAWSLIKPACPLCKSVFATILHEIRSDSEFATYAVPVVHRPPPPPPPPPDARASERYARRFEHFPINTSTDAGVGTAMGPLPPPSRHFFDRPSLVDEARPFFSGLARRLAREHHIQPAWGGPSALPGTPTCQCVCGRVGGGHTICVGVGVVNAFI
jgi:hypothetical protein